MHHSIGIAATENAFPRNALQVMHYQAGQEANETRQYVILLHLTTCIHLPHPCHLNLFK